MNGYAQDDDAPIEVLYIDESASERQSHQVEQLKKSRNDDRVARALDALQPLERPVRVHGLVYDLVSRKLRNLHVSVTVGEAGATA